MRFLNAHEALYASRFSSWHPEPLGCSEREVARLEGDLGVVLPAAFKEFLVWMGKDAVGPLQGTERFFGDLLWITAHLPALLAHNGIDFESSRPHLCFFSHQGYFVGWFFLDEQSDDPACWKFMEGPNASPTPAGTFSEWLYSDLVEASQVWESLGR